MVRKTVHFGGARRIPEENKDEEKLEEKAVATLSLSVQVPAGDVKTLGENGWREQSSMSQLLEKKDEQRRCLQIQRPRKWCPTTRKG